MPVLSSDDKQENRLLHTDSVPSFYRGVQFSCLLLNPPGIVLVGGGAIGAGMFALPTVHGFLGHCRFFIGMEYDLAHGKFAGKSKSGSGIRAWQWY